MTQKQNIRNLLIAGLVAASLGGWLLHLRIHHPGDSPVNLIPFIAGLISIVVLPAMFFSRKTLAYAYVVNGMIVIIGTITMCHVSLMRLPHQVTLTTIFLGTLLADIILLFTKFLFGKALFELEMLKAIDAIARHKRFWRYPNMGWWWVHLFSLTTAYVAGYFLWR
ncbi:MAG: hypothetical protein ABSF80_03270 [Chitinispirillaceae bacterium]|jgi:hypothetical protein